MTTLSTRTQPRGSRPVRLAAAAALTTLAAALFAPVAAAPAHASSTTDAEKSVVYLDITFEGAVKLPFETGAETYTASVGAGCTGWFASTQAHIVTAAHCVEKSDDVKTAILQKVLRTLGYSEYAQRGSDENWASVTGVAVRAYQPQGVSGAVPALQSTGLTAQLIDAQTFDNGDLALLKIADLDGTPALPVAAKSPGIGERVTSVGFAGAVTNVSDASRQRASFKTGAVSSRQVTTTGVPITEIDAAVTQGMSGGPTLDQDGRAVGINSFKVRGESQAFNFVTDTAALTAFLGRNGVTVAAPSSTAQASGAASAGATGAAAAPAASADTNLPLMLGIGGGALAVVAAGAVLLVVFSRRRASGQAAGAGSPSPAMPAQAAVQPVAYAPAATTPAPTPGGVSEGGPQAPQYGQQVPTGFQPTPQQYADQQAFPGQQAPAGQAPAGQVPAGQAYYIAPAPLPRDPNQQHPQA